LGAMLHSGLSSASTPALNTDITSTDIGFGVYGSTGLGVLDVKFGADYQHHAISSTRNVALGTGAQRLTADYGGATTQVFGEVSADFELNQVMLTPYTNLAVINVATDAFSEAGGSAALSVDAANDTFF